MKKFNAVTTRFPGLHPGTISLAVLAMLGAACITSFTPLKASEPEAKRAAVEARFSAARLECAAALDRELAGIHRFFEGSRAALLPYSRQARSLANTVRAAGGYVGADGGLSSSLRVEFSRTVMSEAELDRVISSAIASYVRQVEQIESELLVALRADLPQLSNPPVESPIDRLFFQAEIRRSVDAAVSAARAEVSSLIGRELVAWAASSTLKSAARSLGESAGLRTKGQADNWTQAVAGFGLDLVTNVVVDRIYEQAFQPNQELAAALRRSLDGIERTVMDGGPAGTGLRFRLTRYSDERLSMRRNQILGPAPAGGM